MDVLGLAWPAGPAGPAGNWEFFCYEVLGWYVHTFYFLLLDPPLLFCYDHGMVIALEQSNGCIAPCAQVRRLVTMQPCWTTPPSPLKAIGWGGHGPWLRTFCVLFDGPSDHYIISRSQPSLAFYVDLSLRQGTSTTRRINITHLFAPQRVIFVTVKIVASALPFCPNLNFCFCFTA